METSNSSTLRRSSALAASAACVALVAGNASAGYPEDLKLGTPATADEVRSIAIAVRPDGKGLPAGSGDWAAGKKVYEAVPLATARTCRAWLAFRGCRQAKRCAS